MWGIISAVGLILYLVNFQIFSILTGKFAPATYALAKEMHFNIPFFIFIFIIIC